MVLELKTVLHQYTVVYIILQVTLSIEMQNNYLKNNWSWKMDEK